MAAIDEGGPKGGVPPLRPQVLNSLQAKVSHRRRRSRLVLTTVTAATAAVLVIGTFIAMRPSGPIPESRTTAYVDVSCPNNLY